MSPATIDSVRRIMRNTGFDEDGGTADDRKLTFSTRENGDMENDRPGRADVLAARALCAEIHKLVPGVSARVITCDEWTIVAVNETAAEVRP